MIELIHTIHEGSDTIRISRELKEKAELIRYAAKLAVDADGCNGQHGLPIAYRVDDKGTDRLVDVGYPRHPDQYSEGLICKPGTREPIVFVRDGIKYYASRTALRFPDKEKDDPESGVDGEFFPYLVVPPAIISKTAGIVLGSFFTAVNLRNGLRSAGVVADIGPHNKIGEGSPALCRELGLDGSPLRGGTEDIIIAVEIQVGVPAYVKGVQFNLQHS